MPADWNPAVPITFQISSDDTDYRDLYRVAQTPEGGWVPYEVAIMSVVPNSILFLPPDAGFNLGWLKNPLRHTFAAGQSSGQSHVRDRVRLGRMNWSHIKRAYRFYSRRFLRVSATFEGDSP